MSVQLKVKKLHPEAVVPQYKTTGAAGMDLTAVRYAEISCTVIRYSTGLAFEIPEGHVGLLFPRSSIYTKDMTLTNCVGVLDSDYRGEVSFLFRVPELESAELYRIGDRIGQLVIVPIPRVEVLETEELSDTARGSGGFGSTGA